MPAPIEDAGGARPLAGKRVAVLEHRELDRLGGMLEAQGAETVRCALVAIVDALDPAPVEAWLRRFVESPPDDLVLMTGEGLRRLLGFAGRAGLEAAFRDAVGAVRTIPRGPKPARALREIGLAPTLRAEQPTTEGVVAALSAASLAARRVAVQLYPNAAATLAAFVSQAGGVPDTVLPYAYVPAVDDGAILALIDEMAAGRVDVTAFTSAPQVVRLFAAAEAAGLEAKLRIALGRTAIAAVGPVVAAELTQRGLAVAIMPRDNFFMKPLVTAIVTALGREAGAP
ncbi:MAG TPA: uroporphyrinogen-III synthase [Stellaceae bacterium]|nr:uroporphyrinogen-III synthase [Stellaceae bacterium]